MLGVFRTPGDVLIQDWRFAVSALLPGASPASGVSTAAGAAVIGLVALSVLFAARKRRG